MIEFSKAYKTSDGVMHPSLEKAQAHELLQVLGMDSDDEVKICETIVAKRAQVLNILTTTKDSRPKARKANGATRTRKPATPAPIIMDEEDAAAAGRGAGAMVEDEG